MAAQPPFLLQIVDENGVVVHTRAGGKHEADLIELVVKSILPRGVGFFKTEAKVEQAIRDGIKDAIYAFGIQ